MHVILALTAGLTAGFLGGCGERHDEPEAARGVRDCGVTVPTDDPPRRVFAVFQNGIEMAHALGLSGRLAGTSYIDNPVLPRFAAAQRRTRYYPEIPGLEELVKLRTDFVISGYNAYTPEQLGSRARLRSAGIGSWLSGTMCVGRDGQGQADLAVRDVTMDTVYADLRGLGRVFHVPGRAEAVIAGMRAKLAKVRQRLRGVTHRPRVALVRFRPNGIVVLGKDDIAQQVIELAGGTNVFSDVRGRLTAVSEETLIDRDPEVIVDVTCCGPDVTTAAARPDLRRLRASRALASISAVRNDRLHAMTFADTSAGVRSADAVATLAGILHPSAD